METGEIVDLKLMRAKFLEHFANRAPCLVAMEACGGSQHWARRIREFGHEVRLLPTKMVRPFVGGNKNDAHDARAIWTAVQQPGVKTVAIKSEEQQAILALHRMRQQLVKFRTAQINGLRGLLTEYGEVMPKGRAGMRRDFGPGSESERFALWTECKPLWPALFVDPKDDTFEDSVRAAVESRLRGARLYGGLTSSGTASGQLLRIVVRRGSGLFSISVGLQKRLFDPITRLRSHAYGDYRGGGYSSFGSGPREYV